MPDGSAVDDVAKPERLLRMGAARSFGKHVVTRTRRRARKRYAPREPRFALGALAAAMAALTFGVLVVLPAVLESAARTF